MKEELIILLAKEGNQDAFHELYEKYRLTIYKVALRYMRLKEDAEDVMHETFIKAFRNIQSFDFKVSTNFSAWIHRICTRCALEHLRKQKNRKPQPLDSLSNPQHDPHAPDSSPEDRAIRDQTRLHLQEALNILSPQQRLIFNLRYAQNQDIKEIAECLQCSESTIKTQHFRAVSKLRKHLEPFWRKL